MEKIIKYDKNPILSKGKQKWENLCVLNPAVVYDEESNEFKMLYRAAGNDREHYIYLGLATSKDGYKLYGKYYRNGDSKKTLLFFNGYHADPLNNVNTPGLKFLKDGLDVDLTFYEGELLGVTLPDKIEYTIAHTEPAVKGNTTNNAQKDAELENGLKIRVPLFINEGEKVLVTTADGKYSSRA